MFTDTHLKGDRELDNMTVSYMVKNIKLQNPDLVILGGDNVTYGFNKKRNIQLAELFENLGVYWATVLGNHEGDGFLSYAREDVIPGARGVVDVFNGEYQLKVFSVNDITFVN